MSDELLVSKLWIQGTILTAMCYGIVVALCFSCFQLLLSRPPKLSAGGVLHKQRSRLLFYVLFLFLLATVSIGLSSKESEVAYVHYQDFPGGPAFFILQDTSVFIAGGAICFVLLQWAVDGLLV